MYVLLIKLIHKTTAENFPDEGTTPEIQMSQLETDLINYILEKDRTSFFQVMKFWLHFEFNLKLIENCPKFDVLFPYVLEVVHNSRLFMLSQEWISFIMTLPAYPQFVFNHIFQVAVNSIHKDVAAIQVCSKIVLSGAYKNSIKME